MPRSIHMGVNLHTTHSTTVSILFQLPVPSKDTEDLLLLRLG